MSDSVLYTRLLLPKGHGYPLFHPQPFDDWPLEARERGIQLGDVGVVISDGSFDPIFNVCRPATDELNRFGVPRGFKQLRLRPSEIASRSQYHRPGSDVSNTKITKRRLDVDAGVDSNVFLPVGAGAVVEITADSKEAAVLLLPEGASRTDVRPSQKFRDYALKHAHRWYEFVNVQLQRMVGSGDLYLVTGIDQSTSWNLAAVEDHSGDCKISLRLKASPVGRAGTSFTWEWETTSSFADWGPRRRPGEEDWTDNQTVFLRGYKVAIRSESPSPLSIRKSCTALSVAESKPAQILSKSGFVPFSQSSSTSGSGGFFRSTGGGSDGMESVESFPDIPKAYHPADAINEYLLASNSGCNVAVTHDIQWASVLNPNEGMPNEHELLQRICERFGAETNSDGVRLRSYDPDFERCLYSDEGQFVGENPENYVHGESGQESAARHSDEVFKSAYIHAPRSRALFIAIANTVGYPTLPNAHSDAYKMRELMRELIIDDSMYGYLADDITMLMDDGVAGHKQPTHANILAAITDFVKDAKATDQLIFYYCGHLTQMESSNRMVECLVPLDGDESRIVDYELHKAMVLPLPVGCRLVVVLDTSSASLLDNKHCRVGIWNR